MLVILPSPLGSGSTSQPYSPNGMENKCPSVVRACLLAFNHHPTPGNQDYHIVSIHIYTL